MFGGLASVFSNAVNSIGSFISGAFGGGSCSSGGGGGSSSTSSTITKSETIYEPDRVRAEELKNERVGLVADAQKEIIEMNGNLQLAIIEAETKNNQYSAEILKDLMRDMNIVTQQRLELLENGHFEIVKKIEIFYKDFEKEVREDSLKFTKTEIPELLNILNQFSPESGAYKIYEKSIINQEQLHLNFYIEKLQTLAKTQRILIESSLETKKSILNQSDKLVMDRMNFFEKQLENRTELAILNQSENIQEIKQLEK